jgi:hypothetical protein
LVAVVVATNQTMVAMVVQAVDVGAAEHQELQHLVKVMQVH